jgi:glycosyltransferase involved in cell wall biosynthesis
VVLFHDFSQALGGASHLVQVLIRELRARDVPVTFIAGDDGANFTRDDVEFIPLHGKALLERSKLGALTKGFYNHDAYAAAKAWIAQNDTPGTVYHVHGWCKILTPSIFSALHPVRDRLILHGHDFFNGCPNGAFFNYRTTRDCPLVPLSGACLACQCDKTGYVEKLWRSGREASRRVQMRGGTNAARLLMIHPGQEANFRLAGWPAEKLIAARNPVSPPLAERVRAEDNQGVLFIGRISAEKGADLAAAAAAQAGVPITFVGDGAEMDAVQQVNPAALMLGRQDRAGVARALAQARVAVMPSRWSEPFGLVALEAIGSGVPVVVSERALVAGEIARAGFGLSLDTNNVSLFAAALSDLAQDDARVAQMSLAGHARYGELCHTEAGWTDLVIENYCQTLAAAAVPATAEAD